MKKNDIRNVFFCKKKKEKRMLSLGKSLFLGRKQFDEWEEDLPF